MQCIKTLTAPSTAAALLVFLVEAASVASGGEGGLPAASILPLRMRQELQEPLLRRQLKRQVLHTSIHA
jgi:hypothetical protein